MSEDAGSGIKVDGLDEFRKELRRAADGKTLRKEFTAEERKIAQRVAQAARAQASGGPQRHFASKITGKASPRKGALVGIAPVANAAFWGAKKNTGWNRAAREGSKAQHPAWVGAAWEVGGPGGPYAINPAIRDLSPLIPSWYGDAIDRVTRPAFPD